ncbi:MAG: hypothetical protein ACOYOB_01975 [Myxococcota bacterium]
MHRSTKPHFAGYFLAALLSLAASTALAEPAAGPYGMTRNGLVGGFFGQGERWGQGGSQVILFAEGGLFTHASTLGNLGGLSGGIQMGWDGVPASGDDTIGLGSFQFDMWAGFPVSLFRIGDLFQLTFEPGMGMSYQASYLNMKLRGGFAVGEVEGDLTGTWWPGATSYATGPDGVGNDATSLKGTLYIGDDPAFFAWGEYYSSRREQESFDATKSQEYGGLNVFGTTTRRNFEDLLRIGLGVAF